MTTELTRSDAELDHAVTLELEWDPRVDDKALAVSVKNGVVTLGGFVDSYPKKLAAREAALSVRGVKDVADEIQVKPAGMAKLDAEIARQIRAALAWDAFVPDERIQSAVSDGWVTLAGDVDYAFQLADAEAAVLRLNGVRGVTNLIVVQPEHVDPTHVRNAVAAALSRRAELGAKAIDIQVDLGIVSLSGAVQSRGEKRAIERVALYTKGVTKVDNSIVVDPEL